MVYHAATMQQIAERVGVVPSALYRAFSGKEAFYTALIQDFVDSYCDCVENNVQQGGDAVDKLRRYVDGRHQFFTQHAGLIQFYTREVAGADPDRAGFGQDAASAIKGYLERDGRLLVAVIQEGIDAGLFRTDDPHRFAVVVKSTTHAFLALCLRDPGQNPYDAFALDVLLRGMLSEQARTSN